MEAPVYLVTFVRMNHKIGANPLGHASFCLSKMVDGDEGPRFEVENFFGFYGSEPSSIHYPVLTDLKRYLKVDTDFCGGYGTLKIEPMRYLDKGVGLDGVTFHVSESQYKHLKTLCFDVMAEEQQAIQEAMVALKVDKSKRIDYSAIFAYEKAQAKLRGEPPRLHPFQFLPTLNNCMNRATSLLLESGIKAKELAILSEGSVPRFSSVDLQPFTLYSEGPLKDHKTKRKGTVKYRQWPTAKDSGSKLYWTLPPQNIVPNPDNKRRSLQLKYFLNIPKAMRKDVAKIIASLQQAEWALLNAKKHTKLSEKLLDYIQSLYIAFSMPSKNHDTSELTNRIDKANNFLDAIYQAAIADGEMVVIVDNRLLHGQIYLKEDDIAGLCTELERNIPSYFYQMTPM